ncbi:MAG TPA: MipA/OmpV family protein [Burkholderiales bacterium]|nr:MipA/OmpV family protein [Burkholderiales bacterium]
MPLPHQPVLISHGSALRMAAVSALVVGLCASAVTAVAAEPTDVGPPSTSWSLGLGGMSRQKPYAGIDRENKAIPLLQLENKYVHIFGPVIELKLPSLDISDSQKLNFSIVGKYDGSGHEADDAPILDGMSKRKGGFWAGAKMEWSSDLVDVSAEWLADASGNSKGQRFNLGLERTWRFGRHMMLTPRVGASWQDKKYVDYYFGVRDDEARIDRPAYEGKSGVNAEVGARGIYMFDKRHSVLLDVEVSSLPKEIKDSPLVDRSTENRVFFGYLYRFR